MHKQNSRNLSRALNGHTNGGPKLSKYLHGDLEDPEEPERPEDGKAEGAGLGLEVCPDLHRRILRLFGIESIKSWVQQTCSKAEREMTRESNRLKEDSM